MAKIYHITTKDNWGSAKKIGRYEFCALKTQGFIHCSTDLQYVRIGNGIFTGREDLVLLEIDENLVEAEVRYENLEGGTENFPHIYGPLNTSAVLAVHDFKPNYNGTFSEVH